MKRIRLLVLAGVIAAALPFGMTTAGATGGARSTNSVTIQQYADYDAAGFVLDVGLYVHLQGRRHHGPNGLVNVQVDQYPPQTPAPDRVRLGPAIGRV